jgi:hypothetical protein
MGVHGGFMGRSLSRFSLLIGSAIAGGSLLAGCASEVPGPAVIGAPAAVAAVAPTPTSNDFLAGLEQAVSSELSAINSTESDNEPPEVLVELNALNNEGSLIAAENFASLITTAANQISKRERLVNALTVDVNDSTYLNGVTVNGSSLSSEILALLSGVDSQLQSQANAVDSAAEADQLRAVILSIGPGTRVLGLVQPAVHLAIAAGEELQAANFLQAQYVVLNKKSNFWQCAPQYADEQTDLGYLEADITSATRTATEGVQAVLALTPAGYPANKATILSVRSQLLQVKSPLGPLMSGNNLTNTISNFESESHACNG